ncbi:hypothetical protein COCC4DRAFT_28505 [Bipolaris maydis ATCC 48331]|uniref:Yeast cell wall synthesis Kre9/Knh1-like N-terminal domain-containing protein n=2 Tax=Cochliobolus heterostrophus TaxID=5016 RepID=M2SIG2_COCH5|nr:uncharacterized protein COCC4DRAFT_28505 [Bipolaris maydis ATCC 48331]EMD85155.1 hypothetical protein COCHEDRAFT_1199052 [Bipolaris maydis C5]KAH7564301.1 hypothetical protein BM1_01348 [Bipolaris maydis]ENH99386.1 hypothetical protein COCC4DRAFT_28505 [Bipolaris maydis ATCC 48331]KAJ5026924.1 hypothetical protein J3E73DRAFT_423622 [Bipolaris maydis]KAJ5059331.1 hypothetical protein J3E74DRAFT_245616 [Bipolaris maydis]
MRFFQAILSSAAFAALIAALEINDFPAQGVVAGNTYTITYSPADDVPTTFILRQGLSTDLDTIGTLTTTATGGKFQWTPSKDLPNESDYALEIKRGDTVNYSAQFPLTGGAASDSNPVSSSSASASPSSSAEPSSSASPSPSASASSSMTSAASSTPSAPVSTPAGNSTVSSVTLSRTHSPTAPSTPTGSASVPEVTTSGAGSLANPLAAIVGAAAALLYFA